MREVPGSSGNGAARLVGRGDELHRLDEALRATAGGAARVVEIVGDPGIGKTRLLAELASRARAAGHLTMWGRAAEFERHVPFGMITDALEAHVNAHRGSALARLPADTAALLHEVFPGTFTDAPADGVLDAERYLLHRAVRALLEVVAEPAGLVLILDDLHWADEGTAELVEYLLRHAPAARVLLAVAHRPRQSAARLLYAFDRAAQDGAAERIDLGPLTAEQATSLIQGELGESHRRSLYDASGGNPFYLMALARGGTPLAGAAPVADGAVPAPVWAALAAELGSLPLPQMIVAQAAAVAGDGVEVDLIARTAGVPLDDVLIALDELARRDLVRALGAGTRFEFRHPLVRHATYETAGPGWRVGAHSRAAAALAERGAPAADQAHHVERSARPGDLAAAALLSEAAAALLNSAPASAAHWLEAALRLLPDDGSATAMRLGLLGLHAKALGITGRLAESRDALHELLRLLPPELAEQRTQIVAFSALVERLLGRHIEARALLLAELASLPDQEGPQALALKLSLAIGHVMRTDPTGQHWAADALATARRNDSEIQVAGALVLNAMTSHLAGGLDDRTAGWLDEAAALADALPDGELAESTEVLGWLGVAEMCQERHEHSVRHLKRVLQVARASGQSHFISYIHGMLGVANGLLGNFAQAAEYFDDELDAATLTGSTSLLATALEHQCWKRIWLGDIDEAVRLGREAVACGQHGAYVISTTAGAMLAAALFNAGDYVGCRDTLVAASGGPDLALLDPVGRPSWSELLAASEAALGRPAEAMLWAERALRTAGDFPRRNGFAHLACVHALLQSDPATAVQHALHAVDAFTRAGDKLTLGRAHHFAALALSECGDADAGREHFARARALFETCGAPFYLDQTVRAERRMNARLPRRGRVTGTGLLTAREQQVAELVGKGLTNRQIAEMLFLSPKTVDVHLGRVYAKLGVSRRAAVAGKLASLSTD